MGRMRIIAPNIVKRNKPAEVQSKPFQQEKVNIVSVEVKKNKKEKKTDMTNENINQMENLAAGLAADPNTKRLKKDMGLIERVESERVVLTADDKQLLND